MKGGGSSGLDRRGGAVMYRGRGVHSDAGMAVFMVVVGEELGAEGVGVFDGPEPSGERRAVFECLNCARSRDCRWTRVAGSGIGRFRAARAGR